MDASSDSLSMRLREQEGIGSPIIQRFLEGAPGINESSITAQLANLKASGDYQPVPVAALAFRGGAGEIISLRPCVSGRGELIGVWYSLCHCGHSKAGAACSPVPRKSRFANLPLKGCVESCQKLPQQTLPKRIEFLLPESGFWPIQRLPVQSGQLAPCNNDTSPRQLLDWNERLPALYPPLTPVFHERFSVNTHKDFRVVPSRALKTSEKDPRDKTKLNFVVHIYLMGCASPR